MIKFREALESEWELLQNQRLNAYSEHSEVIPGAHWEKLKEAITSGAERASGAECLVAEVDGKIAGSVVLCPENTDAYKGLADLSAYPEIRMLSVEKTYRNQGIAEALINECLNRARVRGKIAVGLHTADFMETAMRLYTRLGFERVPEQDFEPANDGIIVKAYRYTF
ncbi:MAG TPA: GNAT family N-acetyltransferase [Sporolactobacillaceae bacterium]|nr:GNAT family N-acetyltransferase [Sporolactobacillaceae bacterium]